MKTLARARLEVVDFHGDRLAVSVGPSGERLVAMKPICEAIGIGWESQYNRIKRHPVLNSSVFIMNMVAEDGKSRDLVCLPLEYLNGWLFGVDAARVKSSVKDRVIHYQKDCFRILYEHFHGAPSKSAMDAFGEAISFMEADKKTASRHGFALAQWKKLRKQHIRNVELTRSRAQLLLGF